MSPLRSAARYGVHSGTVMSAAGLGIEALWANAAAGQTALRANDLEWCNLTTCIGRVDGLEAAPLPAHWSLWDCRQHRLVWQALSAPPFQEAVSQAKARFGAQRVGLALATTTSGMRDTEVAYAHWQQQGAWPSTFSYRHTHAIDALCRFSALALEVSGPMLTVSTACSSSAKVFLQAQRWLDAGLADAVVVGGADSLCLTTLLGFHSLQLASDEPCRPFDLARKGISIGEAAGFMLLTRADAEVAFVGGGESSDAYHLSTPHPQGEGAQAAMRAALNAAGVAAADIGYVNAHGTATPSNDRAESAALAAVFGAHGVPVSSTKGVTGHTLGAAGIVEAMLTVEALRRRTLLPCAQLQTVDPELAVDVVRVARPQAMRYAMSNSFGFGGSNCALIFGRAE